MAFADRSPPARPAVSAGEPQPGAAGGTAHDALGAARPFDGTDRFLLLRRLGAGAFGVVYEAYDRLQRRPLALKVLSRQDAESLYRFKREFRALAGVRHPNLVTLYELFHEAGEWFFTMDLVAGAPLGDHLDAPGDRRALGDAGAERIRAALRGVAAGLEHLHSLGKLHQDVKPGNVLVTPDGHATLLDFGMANERGPLGFGESVDPRLMGTLPYMAPEQLTGEPVAEATDWYALGVVLYEALAGELPFAGALTDLVEQKRRAPPPPSARRPGVPADLERLTLELLDPDPRRRPAGGEVLRRLGAATAPAELAAPAGDRPFVGRETELATLLEALRATRRGVLTTVAIHGPSGVGKTALVERFLTVARERDPDLVVLQGRCHEHEAVPFKALDPLIDALSRYLRGLPRHEAEGLLPRDVLALARAFPVLLRVESIAGARRRVLEVTNPHELRRRAFAALRDLLARLAERHTVVLFLDDLQWGDADSASFFAELHRPPDPPPLVNLGCFRSADRATSPLLRETLPLRAPAGSPVRALELELPALAPADAARLARALLAGGARAAPSGDSTVAAIARESAGNPLLLEELVSLASGGDTLDTALPPTLRQAVDGRVAALTPAARHLLELVASAGRPLPVRLIERVAGTADRGGIEELRAARLVRTVSHDGGDALEVRHDLIRQAVLAGVEPRRVRDHRRRFAEVLAQHGFADPESFVVEGRVEAERAATYAAVAARHAAEALAFDRAARLFELALRLLPADSPDRHDLQVHLGEALANAGNAPAAAAAYLDAAADDAELAFDLERRAAEQLLLAGRLASAEDVIRRFLARVRLRPPPSAWWSRILAWLHRAEIAVHDAGLLPPRRDPPPLATVRRADACWTVAAGLRSLEPERAALFQARQLALALRSGDARRIARARALDPAFVSGGGGRTRRAADGRVRRAFAAAERSRDEVANGLALLTAAMVACGQGRWRECRELALQAERVLGEHCASTGWELGSARYFAILGGVYTGEWPEVTSRLPQLVRFAEDCGNLYAETLLRPWIGGLALLAADRPEAARADLVEASERWYQGKFHYQHFNLLLARVQLELYVGDVGAARQALVEQWPEFARSLVRRVQFLHLHSLDLQARVALAEARTGDDDARGHALGEARLLAARMEHERMPWGDAMAALIRARAAPDPVAARGLLAQAEAALHAAGMTAHALAAARRAAELSGAERAERLAAVDRRLSERGVHHPERMVAMLAP